MRWPRLGFVLALGLAPACNSLLGNEERTLDPDGDNGGVSSGGTSGKGGGASGKGGANAGGDPGSNGGIGAEAGLGGDTGTGGMMPAGNGGAGGDGGCSEGETRCALPGEPEQCVGGIWESLGACDASTPVCYEGACVVCAPDTFRCVGKRLDECDDAGSWQTLQTCPSNAPVCNSLTGSCSNLLLRGGLTTLGVDPSASPSFIVRGEISIQPRACDSGATFCVRGGIVP